MNFWMMLKKLVYYTQMQAVRKQKKEMSDIYYFAPTLEITTRIGCKVACRACPQTLLCQRYIQGKTKNPELSMTMETFQRCVDKLPKKCQIVFSGFAEPFLNDRCADMILYAFRKGYGIDLYTTLVGMTIQTFKKIEKVPFQNLVVHIPDDMGSTNIEMSEEYFKVLRLFLAAKRENGESLVTGLSCHGYPPSTVTKYLKAYGFKKYAPDFMVDRAGNLNNTNMASRQVKAPLFCTRSDSINHFVLLPDGRVVLCCMDFGLRHVLGNLLLESYEDIVHGTELVNLKHVLLEDGSGSTLCHNCTAAVGYEEVSFFTAIRNLCLRDD